MNTVLKRATYIVVLAAFVLSLGVFGTQQDGVQAEVNMARVGSIGNVLAPVMRLSTNLNTDSQGNIYYLNLQNSSVVKLTSSGQFITQWGGMGVDNPTENDFLLNGISRAESLAIDKVNEFAYVEDASEGVVWKYDLNGQLLGVIGLGVSDGTESAIQYCSSNCLRSNHQQSFANWYAAKGLGLAVDLGGNVYTYGGSSINKISPAGQLVWTVGWDVTDGVSGFGVCSSNCAGGNSGSGDGQFGDTYSGFGGGAITVDESGNVYASDSTNRRVNKFSSNGQFQASFGLGVSNGAQEHQVCSSDCRQGVEADYSERNIGQVMSMSYAAGKLYVVSTGYNGPVIESIQSQSVVKVYNTDGTFNSTVGEPSCEDDSGDLNAKLCFPMSVMADSSGNTKILNIGSGYYNAAQNNKEYMTLPGAGILSLSPSGEPVGLISNKYSDKVNGSLDSPVGSAVDSEGNIYIADARANKVVKLDKNGNYLNAWGVYGQGEQDIKLPLGVAVDSQDRVYVTDPYNSRIQIYSKLGEQEGFIGCAVFDSYGDYCTTDHSGYNEYGYESDSYGSYNEYGEYGESRADFAWFRSPTGIAIDSEDNIIVVDSEFNTVQKINRQGAILTKYGTQDSYGYTGGRDEGNFSAPGGVAVDSHDNVYVAEHENNRVQKFNADGDFVSVLGVDNETYGGSGDGESIKPTGMTVDANDNVYVVDTFNMRVQKYNDQGQYQGAYDYQDYLSLGSYLGYGYVKGITAGANGVLYVSNAITGNLDVLCDNDVSTNGCEDITLPPSEGQGVVSIQNAVNGKNVFIEQTGCELITNAGTTRADTLADKDGNDYPVGFVAFSLTGCSNGGSSIVTVTFAGITSRKDAILRKYNATTQRFADVPDPVYSEVAVQGGKAVQAVYTITDGGPLDEDGVANGVIVDPVGLGFAPGAGGGGFLANTGALAVPVTLILGTLLGSLAYLWRDYQKHKMPLAAADPMHAYGFGHHVRVVTLPLLRYRLRLDFEKVGVNSRIRRF